MASIIKVSDIQHPGNASPNIVLDNVGGVTFSSTIKTEGYTVDTLPTGIVGMRTYVTDATSPSYLGALTGGGAVVCPVFHNGTAWVSA